MKERKKSRLGRIRTLLVLMIIDFFILLISIGAAVVVLFLLERIGIMPGFSDSTFFTSLIFLLLVSLSIGMVMAGLSSALLVRPLQSLTAAAKQISTGDFDARVEPAGTAEMQQLGESFNEMASDLGSLETLRSDFVSNISHEFKTPIVSIRGFAKLLKKQTLSQEKRDEYLEIIISESDRMAKLSGNVLLLSNLDSTQRLPDSEGYSLDEQLRRALLVMEPELTKKDITLEVELSSVNICGNEEMLQQVWLNILGNAVKFTPEHGEISVSLTKNGDHAHVRICDSGIGMEEEELKHIFDKFYQADRSRKTQGNGLGLSLVKRITELSGGEVAVESAPGQGSCFTVRLPAATNGGE